MQGESVLIAERLDLQPLTPSQDGILSEGETL